MRREGRRSVYYNTAAIIDADGKYLGKYRKHHIPHCNPGFWEKFYFKPGNLGYPAFETKPRRRQASTSTTVAASRRARVSGSTGAEIVFNPSATVAGLSEYLWKLEQPAPAVVNAYFVGAINHVGTWSSPGPSVSSTGKVTSATRRPDPSPRVGATKTELIVADLDLDKIREVRNVWQFYRDRRPETHQQLAAVEDGGSSRCPSQLSLSRVSRLHLCATILRTSARCRQRAGVPPGLASVRRPISCFRRGEQARRSAHVPKGPRAAADAARAGDDSGREPRRCGGIAGAS